MKTFEEHYESQLVPVELNGAVFHVRLPNADNVRFQRALSSQAINVDLESGGYERKPLTLEQMVELQIETFVRTCIRRVEGWDGYSQEKLLSMPDACEDLWREVSELTNRTEQEAETAVKKPQTTLNGPENGEDVENSIAPSKQAAG